MDIFKRKTLKVVKIKDADFRESHFENVERESPAFQSGGDTAASGAQKHRNFQHDCLSLYTQTSNVPSATRDPGLQYISHTFTIRSSLQTAPQARDDSLH